MKKFKLDSIKISKKSNLKIKTQLYILILKKHFSNIPSILKILAPVCVFAFVVLGVNGVLNSPETGIDNNNQLVQVITETEGIVKNKSLAKTIISDVSKNKYKQRSHMRMRSQKYKKYKNLAQLRTTRLRTMKRG